MWPKYSTHLFGVAPLELAQTAPLFDPAKHLLDAAAGVDRVGVARVTGGAENDRRTTRAGGILRHLRRIEKTKPCVVVLVGADRLLVGDPAPQDQRREGIHEHMAPVERLGADDWPSSDSRSWCRRTGNQHAPVELASKGKQLTHCRRDGPIVQRTLQALTAD